MSYESTTIRDQARELLINRPRSISYKDIEKATGIKERWLRGFAQGELPNPAVNTIEKLTNFLNQQ